MIPLPLYLSLAALSCLSFASAELLHIPLMRVRAPRAPSTEDYANAAGSLRNKYGHSLSLASKRQDGTVIVPFFPEQIEFTIGYGCEIFIGTPPQSFTVYLTTMSADLWVISGSCVGCNASAGFINNTSSTFRVVRDSAGQPIQASTNSLGLVGDLVQDTVSANSGQANQVQHQSWILIDGPDYGLPGLFGSASGVMGFGIDTTKTGATTFWQSLVQGNQSMAPEMGVWLGHPEGIPGIGGTLTLGGRNQYLYQGDVEFLPLAIGDQGGTGWPINVSGITVNKNDITLPPDSIAYIHIGSTLIRAPDTIVSAIYTQIPDSQPLSGNYSGYYGFLCNATVEITMTFGGRIWPINPEDMNLGRVSDGSTMCVGGISVVQGMNDSTWIVGGPFLKSVHSVFRLEPPSVGFAELSFEGGGTSGLPRSGNESGDANNGSDPNNGKNNNAGADAVVQSQSPSVMILTTAASLFACLFGDLLVM